MSDWDGNTCIRKMSFSGCGFRGSYHLGVIQCFRDKGRSVLDEVEVFSGCSAGGLCAAVTLLECPIEKALNFTRQMVRDINSSFFGALNPSFQFAKYLRDGIDILFPKNAHKLASGRLHLSVTSVGRISNTVICQFETREEFINALVATSYIPGYMGIAFPTHRGEQYVDGGLTNNLLYADHLDTLTISPLKGVFDICPIDPYEGRFNAGCYPLSGHKLDFSLFNLQNVFRGLFPSSESAMDELFREGYQDALLFLYKQQLTEEYSAKHPIPLPPTCPIFSYRSDGSICIDMDSLVTSEEDVFLNSLDDEGFFEADIPKSKLPTKPQEISNHNNTANNSDET